MVLSHEELTESIYCSLFEPSDWRSPESIEKEYRERSSLLDEFTFEKGDEWITKSGRYVFQESKTFHTKRRIKLVFIPHYKTEIQFIPYTFNKRAKLLGRPPYDLSRELATEVRTYLIPEIEAERAQDSISKRDGLGIGRRRKDVKRLIQKTYRAIGFKPREKKKELIQRITQVLKTNTEGIDSRRMMLFYIAIVLMVSKIETGKIDTIARRLQASFRGLRL